MVHGLKSNFPQGLSINQVYPLNSSFDTSQEQDMTPEEIVADLNAKNRDAFYAHADHSSLTHAQVLALMDAAAMQGFKLGSNVALSMVKGALLVQLTRTAGAKTNTSGA
jgi:hypothetical protein